MLKKYLTLTLTILIMNLFFGISAFAQTQNDKDSRLVLNIKNTVAGVGTEPNRKIKITLKDGTKLKGYVTEIKDDNFVLVDKKKGKAAALRYSQVGKAKSDGFSKITAIFVAAAVTGAVVLATYAAFKKRMTILLIGFESISDGMLYHIQANFKQLCNGIGDNFAR